MANIEWSSFPSGGDMQVGDITVGLRSGVNFQFTFPSDGIKDASGNILFAWSPVAGAVNYLQVFNAGTGTSPYMTSAGGDASPNLTLKTQGSGNILFTPGGTGNIQCSTHLILSTSSPATSLEAASKGYVDSVIPAIPVTLANGGTSASLTASNGGIFYSTAAAGAILSGTATASQVLLSGSSAAPAWSTAVYPGTVTVNNILYGSSSNVISGLSTANNGVLVTSNAGAPSILVGSGATGNILQSNTAAAPSWSSATYPSSTTINQLLYSSSNNTVAGLATAVSSTLITSAGGVPSLSQTLPSAVQANITTVGTVTSGTWNATVIAGQYGGTGVNNSGKTITLGGSLTTVGAFDSTFTMTGTTGVTFPTSGTLATTANIPSLPLSLANGGTNANLTASNGGIFYSTATAGAILSGTATANQVLVSGSNGAPSWSQSPSLSIIKDTNGNNSIELLATSTAVNYLRVANSATGNNVILSAVGSDSDIGLSLVGKGTKAITLFSGATSTALILSTGTSNQHTTNFSFANTAQSRTVTWPDASGTVAFTSDVPSLPLSLANGGTNASLTASNGGIVYSNATAFAVLAGTATANQVLISGSNTTPSWSTQPYLTNILDSSGAINLSLGKNGGGSAVNYLQILNSQASTNVAMTAIGNDTDITIQSNTKGAGAFSYFTTASSSAIAYNTGTAYQHVTNFTFSNTSANRTVTWPDSTGTVALLTSGTWTPTDASGASLTFTSVSGNYVSMGGVVIATCTLTYPVTVSGSAAVIGGLPFTVSATTGKQGGSVVYTSISTLAYASTSAGTTTANLWTSAGASVLNSAMSASVLYLQFIYIL